MPREIWVIMIDLMAAEGAHRPCDMHFPLLVEVPYMLFFDLESVPSTLNSLMHWSMAYQGKAIKMTDW